MFFGVPAKNILRWNKGYFLILNVGNKFSVLNDKRRKKEIIVLHPVINEKKQKKKKSIEEIILDAQEALGLARSANFHIATGISIPKGGWNIKNEENTELQKQYNEQQNQDNGYKVDDNHEKNSFTNMNMTEIEKKIAESVIIKAHSIDSKFYFGKGKLNDIGTYYLKTLTPYIFINTLLSPEHLKNLDLFFNSLLQGYQNDLKLQKEKNKIINREMQNKSLRKRIESVENFEKEEIENEEEEKEEEEAFLYEDEEKAKQAMHLLYNDYVEIEQTETNNNEEEEEEEWDDIEDEGEEGFDSSEWDESVETGGNQLQTNSEIYHHNSFRRKNVPLYVEIFDRYGLILHIFKNRANSNLTKLQVEIARAKFIFNNYAENNKSRIKYIHYIQNNVLSKSFEDYENKCSDRNTFDVNKKGKPNWSTSNYTTNFIKSSETYKEYEKRIINNLFSKLKTEVEKWKKNRNLQSKARMHKALIAVVGYTNVGKTRLINYLTKSTLKTKNVLFQTLDNSYKNLHIANSYSTILVDSIGFIQNIPYSLLEAFQITLDPIKNADIIIHVIDITHPCWQQHKKCVLDTLQNIGISSQVLNNNVIEVWNKIDKLSEKEMIQVLEKKPTTALPISAYRGTNCDILTQIIQHLINKIKNVQVVTLQFETKEAQERIQFLTKHFKVVPNSITYSKDGNVTSIQVVENAQNLKKYYERFDS